MNRLWTEEEDNIIRADSAARIARTVTAARLGRPLHATRNRALKLGQQIQVHVPWSAADEAALRAALTQEVPAPTDNALSRRLDRKIASIRSKIKELGLAGPRRYRRDRAVGEARLRARAERAEARLAGKAAAGAALAERRDARDQKRAARLAARAAKAEARAAERAARAAARAAQPPKPPVVKPQVARPPVVKPRMKAPPQPTAQERDAAIARMRDAWRRVSAAPAQRAADPAEAERRLLAMLSLR